MVTVLQGEEVERRCAIKVFRPSSVTSLRRFPTNKTFFLGSGRLEEIVFQESSTATAVQYVAILYLPRKDVRTVYLAGENGRARCPHCCPEQCELYSTCCWWIFLPLSSSFSSRFFGLQPVSYPQQKTDCHFQYQSMPTD